MSSFQGGKSTMTLFNKGGVLLIDHGIDRSDALRQHFEFNMEQPTNEGVDNPYKPSADDYIYVPFRMISAAIVAPKTWRATNFGLPGVLKKSIEMIKGISVFTDHNSSSSNVQGVVFSAKWDTQKKHGDKVIPGGINGVYKINAKRNQGLAAALLADPPELTGSSVTVEFEWKPSHAFSGEYEFYDAIGTIHDDGKMVTRDVTNITAYHETSIVDNGADIYARILGDDGKPLQVQYEKAFTQLKSEIEGNGGDLSTLINNRWIAENSISNELLSLSADERNPKPKEMDETLKLLLAKHFEIDVESFKIDDVKDKLDAIQLVNKAEYSQLVESEKTAKGSVETLKAEIDTQKGQIAKLKSELKTATETIEANKPYVEAGKADLELKREEAKRLYEISCGGKTDDNMLNIIKGADFKGVDAFINMHLKEISNSKFTLQIAEDGTPQWRTTIASKETDGGETEKMSAEDYDNELLNKF